MFSVRLWVREVIWTNWSLVYVHSWGREGNYSTFKGSRFRKFTTQSGFAVNLTCQKANSFCWYVYLQHVLNFLDDSGFRSTLWIHLEYFICNTNKLLKLTYAVLGTVLTYVTKLNRTIYSNKLKKIKSTYFKLIYAE